MAKKGFNQPFSQLRGMKAISRAPKEPKKQVPNVKLSPQQDTDDNLFANAMRGTTRLGEPLRVEPRKQEEAGKNSDEALALIDFQTLNISHLEIHDSPYVYGRVSGISMAVVKDLHRGAYPRTTAIDLHGLKSQPARTRLIEFLEQAQRQEHRCVTVITGKGLNSSDGEGVLRQALPQWLKELANPCVLAFCSAAPDDGGDGAFYVLLRRKKRTLDVTP